MHIDRPRRDTAESFGVMIGTTSVDRREIWIEQVTTPMPRDRRARFSFALRDPGHQRIVCGMFARSGGRSIYLGTWHTHPVPVPTPSRIDRKDWVACLRANPGRPLAFALVGTDRTRVFVRKRWGFRPLSEECGAPATGDPRESTVVQTREPPMPVGLPLTDKRSHPSRCTEVGPLGQVSTFQRGHQPNRCHSQAQSSVSVASPGRMPVSSCSRGRAAGANSITAIATCWHIMSRIGRGTSLRWRISLRSAGPDLVEPPLSPRPSGTMSRT